MQNINIKILKHVYKKNVWRTSTSSDQEKDMNLKKTYKITTKLKQVHK